MEAPLHAVLVNLIRGRGPLSIADYMAACLYHPQHGYYTQGLNFSTTPPRDFLTAPEISPLFGYTLAHAVAKAWSDMGQPKYFTLVEVGPGRGTLMNDILTQLTMTNKPCMLAIRPWLIETSPALTLMQQMTLGGFSTRHATSLKEIPDNQPALLIANELLDAFPIRQFVFKNNQWFENIVEVSASDELTLGLAPATPPLPANWQPVEGAILETSATQTLWLESLKALPKLHTAWLLDYGYTQLPPQGGDTLQALCEHKFVSPLSTPGNADLTAHVNFAQVAETLGEKCTTVDLAPFLLANGLPALGLQHPQHQPALQRLLHPAQMGTLFKVTCFTPSTR